MILLDVSCSVQMMWVHYGASTWLMHEMQGRSPVMVPTHSRDPVDSLILATVKLLKCGREATAAKPARLTCVQQLMSRSSSVVRPARAEMPASVTRQHWLMLRQVSHARAGSGSASCTEDGLCNKFKQDLSYEGARQQLLVIQDFSQTLLAIMSVIIAMVMI